MSKEFKLVPVEPTEEMKAEGCMSCQYVSDWDVALIYEAMLAAAPQPTALGEWAIDESAGRPILTYKGCSVIESEDAEYVMRLVAGDKCATVTPALGGEPEVLAWRLDSDSWQGGLVIDTSIYPQRPDWAYDEDPKEFRVRELIDRAHLAPLQTEVERLKYEDEIRQMVEESLRVENDQLKARCDELEAALSGLVTINEQHNAAVAKIIETPLGWKDDYLNTARAALSKPAGSEQV